MLRKILLAVALVLAGLARPAAAELALAPGEPLTPAAVAELVQEELEQRGLAGRIALEVRQPAAALPNLAASTVRVRLAELRHDRRTGRFQGRIESSLASGETAVTPVSGRADELVEVPVPARPVARGAVVAADDLVMAWLPMAALPDDGLRRPEDLAGRQAVRALAAGRAVRAGEVAAPWAVERGDRVGMSFSRGGLQIVTAAEVLENGRPGDTVRVRNAVSGEVREALVLGPRRVEVRGMAP